MFIRKYTFIYVCKSHLCTPVHNTRKKSVAANVYLQSHRTGTLWRCCKTIYVEKCTRAYVYWVIIIDERFPQHVYLFLGQFYVTMTQRSMMLLFSFNIFLGRFVHLDSSTFYLNYHSSKLIFSINIGHWKSTERIITREWFYIQFCLIFEVDLFIFLTFWG